MVVIEELTTCDRSVIDQQCLIDSGWRSCPFSPEAVGSARLCSLDAIQTGFQAANFKATFRIRRGKGHRLTVLYDCQADTCLRRCLCVDNLADQCSTRLKCNILDWTGRMQELATDQSETCECDNESLKCFRDSHNFLPCVENGLLRRVHV